MRNYITRLKRFVGKNILLRHLQTPYIYDEKELANLKQVLDSKNLAAHDTGFVGRFEREFAKRIGAKHGIAANAAMSLLHASINAAGAGVGDEVICDPIVQFHAVAAMYNNAHPVFADVDPRTYLIDPASVQERITKHTKAIVCTNLWGVPCELDALRQIADEHDVVLIEDCAHSLFAKFKGKNSGTWGHIGIFSFCYGKHLSTGDGGMAVTNDEELMRKIRAMIIFGETPPELAWNYRMTELVAAVGLAQLDKVEGYINLYNANSKILDEVVDECRWLERRMVPKDRTLSAYIYACTFRGEDHGINYDDFKDAVEEVGASAGFGYTQLPAYKYRFFQVPLAYGNKGCPLKCQYYKGSFEYMDGLCPVAEDLIPRLVTIRVIARQDEVLKNANLLRKAIRRVEGK